jgi:chromosome segregation ATPase
MSEIAEIIDTLEARLQKLLTKLESLEKSAEVLKQELKQASVTIQDQSLEIETLKSQQDTLRIANSLLGSDENKRDTKLKINSLIREIDYCIAQLSD